MYGSHPRPWWNWIQWRAQELPRSPPPVIRWSTPPPLSRWGWMDCQTRSWAGWCLEGSSAVDCQQPGKVVQKLVWSWNSILYCLFYLVLHELTWLVTSKLIQLNSIHLFIIGQSFHKLKILISMSAKRRFDIRGVYPKRFASNFLTNFSLNTTPKRVIITCHTIRSSSVQ